MDQKENGVMRDSSSSLKPAYTLSVFVGGSVSLLTSVMYLCTLSQKTYNYINLYYPTLNNITLVIVQSYTYFPKANIPKRLYLRWWQRETTNLFAAFAILSRTPWLRTALFSCANEPPNIIKEDLVGLEPILSDNTDIAHSSSTTRTERRSRILRFGDGTMAALDNKRS